MGDLQTAVGFYNQALSIPRPEPVTQNPQLQYQLLSSAVIADQTLAPALYELANANRDMGLHHAAIALYSRLLQIPFSDEPTGLKPDIAARALVNMSHSLYTVGRMKEALGMAEQAISMDGNLSLAWLNKSLSLSVLDELDESLIAAENAYALEPGNPIIGTALAFAQLFKGHYSVGLAQFEDRFPYRMPHFASYPYPKWLGDEDKTLYLISEQGLGDALSFSRFIEMAAKRSKFIRIIVQKELVRLLSASLQHIRNIEILGSPQPFLPADCWTTFMSLPFAMNLTNDQIVHCPHITVPEFRANPNFKNPDAKFHIAVAWKSSAAGDIAHWKNFEVRHLLELYRVPGVQLYSIQADDSANEIHSSGAATLIRDLRPFITDVADTIGILRHMDLVVTTESLPGHIAGFMGKECWIPYSRWGRDWRASSDGRSPIWYPNHRFFRQYESATWEPVFDNIVEALAKKVSDHGQ